MSREVSKVSEPLVGRGREVLGVTLFAVMLLCALCLFSYQPAGQGNLVGPVGSRVAEALFFVFGVGSYSIALVLGVLALNIMRFGSSRLRWAELCGLALLTPFSSILIHLLLPPGARLLERAPGGLMGLLAGETLRGYLSNVGSVVLVFAVLLSLIIWLTDLSVIAAVRFVGYTALAASVFCGRRVVQAVGVAARWLVRFGAALPGQVFGLLAGVARRIAGVVAEYREARAQQEAAKKPVVDPTIILHDREANAPPAVAETSRAASEVEAPPPAASTTTRKRKAKGDAEETGTKIELLDRKERGIEVEDLAKMRAMSLLTGYVLPKIDFLQMHEEATPEDEQAVRERLRANAELLIEKLASYGVPGEVREIRRGPVVTLYEFAPNAGIKISKIANLSNDLAMALSAVRVRIVAPIPGKNVVGIEVPNEQMQTVYLKEIIGSQMFAKQKSRLALALGKDIEGNPYVQDLARMPHL
ncbi:MAG: DNA translocase FtsK 4TM domain-containing protein, partial [Pseudomonadota bacterium]